MTYDEDLKATVAAIGREYQRLAAWLRTFRPADWEKPTFCPDWDAAQVVGHLAFGAEFFASSVGNGLRGDLGLPFGARDREAFMKIREEKAREIAALPPAALVERFERMTAEVHALFASLKPADYERPAWHRRGIFPVRRFILSRLNELLLHEWDIRNRPEAPLEGESVALAAGNLRQQFQLFCEMDPPGGLSGTFGFALTDAGRRWAMRVGDGRAEDLGPGGHPADVVFSASAGDMLLLATGRADVERRKREGRLRVEGDADRARAIMPKLFFPL